MVCEVELLEGFFTNILILLATLTSLVKLGIDLQVIQIRVVFKQHNSNTNNHQSFFLHRIIAYQREVSKPMNVVQ